MEPSNKNAYVTYQLFFTKFLEEYGCDFEVLESDADTIDYMIFLEEFRSFSFPEQKVLLSVDVHNNELTLFSIIETKSKTSLKKINELNNKLPFGKVQLHRNKVSYYLKTKLPETIEEFYLEWFEEYVMEIKFSILYFKKIALGF